jgi:hypothetical protein
MCASIHFIVIRIITNRRTHVCVDSFYCNKTIIIVLLINMCMQGSKYYYRVIILILIRIITHNALNKKSHVNYKYHYKLLEQQ